MAFRGVDYFCVDSLFSAEELLVRQTARRFADERILPLIRECYREARFPSERTQAEELLPAAGIRPRIDGPG
jgi:glutaryl-CoA dehydrogenase